MRRKFYIFSLFIPSLVFCLLLSANTLLAQEETKKHVVKELDNYYSLSLKYDISVNDLRNANPGISSPKPGDILIIPEKGSAHSDSGNKDCSASGKARHEIIRVALMIPLA